MRSFNGMCFAIASAPSRGDTVNESMDTIPGNTVSRALLQFDGTLKTTISKLLYRLRVKSHFVRALSRERGHLARF